ncbi:hypothetical protein AAG565_09500 [Fontimonas sp. SYSU GA230001]|uniref:hypothetical protein n=1 Tax=Fontimonas sp. SYSU GA230001 TaxID=3142450 RepID=UPI0032B4159B
MKHGSWAALLVVASVLLPACASNEPRSAEDKALARERAAEERGRREAEDDMRRQQAMQQQQRRRPSAGVGGVELPEPPEPPAVTVPPGLIR